MKSIYTLILALVSFSFVFGQNVQTGNSLQVNERTTNNLYLLGGDININKTVEGDLVAAGGEILLRDSLMDDVLLAGGSVNVNAYCADDLRMIGGEVYIAEDVMGDLLITAGEVVIKENVTIHGSLIGMAGELEMNGKILGDVKFTGGEVEINGNVLGRMDLRGGEIEIDAIITGPTTLSSIEIDLGSDAHFQSDVSYWTKRDEPDFDHHMEEGASAHYDADLKSELLDINFEKSFKEGIIYWSGFRLISGLFLTLVLFLVFGNYFRRNAGTLTKAPQKLVLKGILAFVGLPILSALAFASVVGIPVGIISSALFVIALMSSNALAAVMGAFEINQFKDKNWSSSRLLGTSLALFIGIRLLSFIPFLGGAVSLLAGTFAVGYVIETLRKRKNDGGAQDELV